MIDWALLLHLTRNLPALGWHGIIGRCWQELETPVLSVAKTECIRRGLFMYWIVWPDSGLGLRLRTVLDRVSNTTSPAARDSMILARPANGAGVDRTTDLAFSGSSTLHVVWVLNHYPCFAFSSLSLPPSIVQFLASSTAFTLVPFAFPFVVYTFFGLTLLPSEPLDVILDFLKPLLTW